MESTNYEYQALARKYRPLSFDDVVGQEHVVSALSNAIDQKRLHHAYLLTGTRGIGKTTIARIIAKSLQCERGLSSHPCGECSACKSIVEGTFPDVIEIDAASQTKVDDTRQMLENTQYPPMQGRYKIYIIDEVHMLTSNSFNALLKTLEEPPSYVKFILATTDPHKIPVTVLSRCLQFQLKALTQEQIQNRIELICTKENIPFDKKATTTIAKKARGSMRDALSLCDQAIALGNGSIVSDLVLNMLGTVGDGFVSDILDLLVQNSQNTLDQVLDKINSLSPSYKTLLDELSIAFHDIALYQMIGGTSLSVFTYDNELLDKYARIISPQNLQLYYQIVLEGIQELPYSDPKTDFEMTLLRLIAFNPEKKKIG